ncbi:response regulator [Marinicrinis lubricantis]|uniref:Response regulator n=1 Tax=Marinicrinis lubricantis TaxID=2086470 RepID=A0ABW1IJ84_9BACL
MNQEIKLLVVDDHPLMAQATSATLDRIDRVKVIGIAENGTKCLEMVEQYKPDIIFLDYYLPDQYGSRLAEKIKKKYPDIHIVIFTGVEVAEIYNQLVSIGVSGVLSKDASEETIRIGVQSILNGHTLVPLMLYHKMRLTEQQGEAEFVLSEDEIIIMNRLIEGFTHEQIAEEIHVSKRSVDNYLRRIYAKLDVKTKPQAIQKFVQSPYYKER